MRVLPRPAINPATLYDTCRSGVRDPLVQLRFAEARQAVMNFADAYSQHAPASVLHTFNPCAHGQPEQVIVGALSKRDLNDLYSDQMVGLHGPGRPFYDAMLASIPLKKCPYCGLGQVSTLDHVLSKSRYPIFSALPDNLVPACADCNKSKGGGVITPENMSLHPYFEPEFLNETSWLKAAAQDIDPVVISFSVRVPANFPPVIEKKLNNHFQSLGLGRRYSVEAASELASIREVFRLIPEAESRRAHLYTQAAAETALNPNSWKAATYRELASTEWFCAH